LNDYELSEHGDASTVLSDNSATITDNVTKMSVYFDNTSLFVAGLELTLADNSTVYIPDYKYQNGVFDPTTSFTTVTGDEFSQPVQLFGMQTKRYANDPIASASA